MCAFVPLQSCSLYLFIRFQNDWARTHTLTRIVLLTWYTKFIVSGFMKCYLKIRFEKSLEAKPHSCSAQCIECWWWWPLQRQPHPCNCNNLGYLSINLSFQDLRAGRNQNSRLTRTDSCMAGISEAVYILCRVIVHCITHNLQWNWINWLTNC